MSYPQDLANWKCICGQGPSLAHQVGGYCHYVEGYRQGVEDAAKITEKDKESAMRRMIAWDIRQLLAPEKNNENRGSK